MTEERTYTKADYRAAKAAAEAANSKLKANPLAKEYRQACGLIQDIRDAFEMDDVSFCEACDEPVFDDDPYSYDEEGGVLLCKDCTPTWKHLRRDPESFYYSQDGEHVYFTAETAAKAIEEHLAAGGSLSDKFALVYPDAATKGGEA